MDSLLHRYSINRKSIDSESSLLGIGAGRFVEDAATLTICPKHRYPGYCYFKNNKIIPKHFLQYFYQIYLKSLYISAFLKFQKSILINLKKKKSNGGKKCYKSYGKLLNFKALTCTIRARFYKIYIKGL